MSSLELLRQVASFGEWLKRRRRALDLTQHDLAACVGCSVASIRKFEANERQPSKQMASRLAQCLGIDPAHQEAFIHYARSADVQLPIIPVLQEAAWPLPHWTSNLASRFAPLLGRTQDLSSVCALLKQASVRLLTLIGPPGIGKTRLGIEVATALGDHFSDGVYLVDLALIRDPQYVLKTIADVLGVRAVGNSPLATTLQTWLCNKHLLLVLDSFEHVLEAAPLVTKLLTSAPHLYVLVTSREPLHIGHEQEYAVPPLGVHDAVDLFLQCAQAVRPNFQLSDTNTLLVAEMCNQLDRLPLAIELAAARVKLFAPEDLLPLITQRLRVLAGGRRDAPARHQTLRHAIEWSYELLDDGQKILLSRLSVFVGGWTLEAAQFVCGEGLPFDILDGLSSLLDKSLLQRVEKLESNKSRFGMLKTIREYALERLAERGEVAAIERRHLDYYLSLAEQAEAHVFGGEETSWRERLEGEWDNLRLALDSSVQMGAADTGLRLAAALAWFFHHRLDWNEGFDWLVRLLRLACDAPASVRSKALRQAGAIASWLGDTTRARLLCRESLDLARKTDDTWNLAWSLAALGFYTTPGLELDQAAASLEESLALFRELHNPLGLPRVLIRRAWVAIERGDYAYANVLLEEAMSLARETDDKVSTAHSLFMIGIVSWCQRRDIRQATTLCEASLSLFRQLRNVFGVTLLAVHLAGLEYIAGNSARSQMLYVEALVLAQETGAYKSPLVGLILAGLGSLAAVQGRLERAAKLLAAGESGIKGYFSNPEIPNCVGFNSAVSLVCAQLGETAFLTAWTQGQAMSREQTITYALQGDEHE